MYLAMLASILINFDVYELTDDMRVCQKLTGFNRLLLLPCARVRVCVSV